MSVAVVVVAAGDGARLGAGVPKALVSLHGRTILDWSVEAFSGIPEIGAMVVVAPATAVSAIASGLPPHVHVVAGGVTRQDSVNRGLAVLDSSIEFVLVHDAARPLVPATVISAVIAALRAGHDAVIPVLPVIDTIKQVDAGGHVTATPDRSVLRRVQTPQGFRLATLLRAHESTGPQLTDDAGLIEALGHPVATVAGDESAFKITTPHELRIAELLAADPAAAGSR